MTPATASQSQDSAPAGQSQGALVRVRNVHKVYSRGNERIDVLQGVNLEVPRGDFLALMGPSGSGKTTLLNLLAGLDRPSEGVVEIGADRIDKMSEGELARWRSRHVGFVFQLYNLLPTLTAERNVELPLLLAPLSGSERKRHVSAALAVVGLADRGKHYPRQLSGGQEQRVAIARAIVADPTLLLCDEPTGDLDRKSEEEILDLLQALNRDHGKTIVMVTHNAHAAACARRTVYLNKGQLQQETIQ
ncbi:MAG TPA: ABC transporter ATP-binding protein [Candidatus Acidoferrales bacterium]|nr:ABC transporter ATP-binding protein [Candidatus Acidoferrales bacterium]